MGEQVELFPAPTTFHRAQDACTCCRSCGHSVPCPESVGGSCAGRCSCGVAEDVQPHANDAIAKAPEPPPLLECDRCGKRSRKCVPWPALTVRENATGEKRDARQCPPCDRAWQASRKRAEKSLRKGRKPFTIQPAGDP